MSLLDILKQPAEASGYGTVARVVSPGRYVVADTQGRRFEAASSLVLAVGERVQFQGKWIHARAGQVQASSVYEV